MISCTCWGESKEGCYSLSFLNMPWYISKTFNFHLSSHKIFYAFNLHFTKMTIKLNMLDARTLIFSTTCSYLLHRKGWLWDLMILIKYTHNISTSHHTSMQINLLMCRHHTCMHVSICVYKHMCEHVHICMCVCMCMHIHAYVCVCLHIHTHVYTFMQPCTINSKMPSIRKLHTHWNHIKLSTTVFILYITHTSSHICTDLLWAR